MQNQNVSKIIGNLEYQNRDPMFVVDWEPMIREILDDIRQSVETGIISAKFHNTLVETIVDVAKKMNQKRIVLTGGCFQNKYLTERAIHRLKNENIIPYWHHKVPPNDGGIALGQIKAVSYLK